MAYLRQGAKAGRGVALKASLETLIEAAQQLVKGSMLPHPKVIAQLANKLVNALGRTDLYKCWWNPLKIYTKVDSYVIGLRRSEYLVWG